MKDKKKVLIISVVLGSLVAFICWINYMMYKSESGIYLQRQASQATLNSIVADIEYYKSQNGKYPDSLGQLKSPDGIIFLTDNLQSGVDTYYNYKNLGDKYLLFSSGEDQIQNTSDDLYPKIKNLKTVGWIKNTTTAGNSSQSKIF